MTSIVPEGTDKQDEDDVYVSAVMSFSDDPQIRVREFLFGISPAVLIEPDVDEEAGRYGFNVASVDLDAESLVSVLRLCADSIEEADRRERPGGDAK